MESTLKRYFGYSQFRPYQKEIIEMVLDGRDCLAVMATGSGKSLCYQIPPLVKKKTAVVISPLLSLMQDQVMSLNQRGIKADYLGSTQKDSTVQCNAESGRFDILYMTPEKACSISPRFWSNLSKAGICLLAVDEAHCISEWGHDFRKEYKQLDALREHLVDVPFIGLTATATEKVRQDILRSLKMTDPYIAVGSFDRNNLFYGVKSFARGMAFVDELVNEISKNVATSGSTIIYCTTVKDAEQIFKSLESAGIRAGLYHGQMGSKAREESHRSFIRDDLHVMVATIAFGMGIDKPNIRCVIHYGCPKSLESYYQGSGRCGRDGLASICWLYYTRSDFAKADFYCAEADTVKQRQAIMESYMAAQRYCLLTTCRRRFLLEYFGEKLTFTKCGNCDNCTSSKMERDMSREALLLLTCIRSCGGHWGLNMPIDILRGSRSKRIVDNNFDKLPSHGIGKDYPPNWWKALAEQLIAHGYLKENVQDYFRTISLSPTGQQFLRSSITVDQPQLILTVTNEMVDEEEHRFEQGNAKGDLQNLASLGFEGFSEAEVKLYHMLLEMRMNLAKNTGTAPYAICGDQTIKKITKIRPSTKVRLANIDGVNQHLVANYGDHIIQTINDMVQELKLSRDGVATVQTAITKRVMPNSHKGLSSAKFDAWRLWQNNGLSIQEISNFPGRSAPIKEGTVILYLIDAAREGCEISWPRLCKDIGLTQEICSKIEAAISKVGSRERLKPIKEELPEDVSYVHIRAFLTMQDLGISTKDNLDPQPSNPELSASQTNTNLHSPPLTACSNENPTHKQPRTDESQIEGTPSKKSHVIVEHESSATPPEATDTAVLEWLRKYDGVDLSTIVEHFNRSKENLVVNLLGSLESEFLIYKKNGLYRVM